jgi:hypothetical protein
VGTHHNTQQNGSKKLNVIFHGAFAFDQTTQPDHILALIPQIEYHVYRAGNWLAETELRGGADSKAVEYVLVGVKPGKAKFDAQTNLIVKPHKSGKPKASPYATLIFPLPDKITSLLRAEISRDLFSHNQELELSSNCQHLATVQVFTYEFDDQNKLMLKAKDGNGHYWEPVLTGDYINLHIFSAEDHYHKSSSAREDFNECADLIGGLELRLRTQFLRASGILSEPDPPAGVYKGEIESLALRTERMARLGRLVTQGADAKLAWYGTDALDGDPEGCTGPVF